MGELPRRRVGDSAGSGRGWRPELPLPLGIALLSPVALLFGLLFLVPLGRVIQISVADPHFGLHRYRAFFESRAEVRALFTTLKVSGIVTGIALLAGATVAWTLRTTRSRALRVLLWIGTIFPLWMSVIVFTYIFTIALERYGIVNRTLEYVGVIHHPAGLLYNTGAVVVAMVYSLIPLAVLPLYASFVNIDLDLVRAAESLGASRLRALFTVVVPLALPGFLAAGSIVFVIAMGFYITPTLLGSVTQPFLASMIADQVGNQFDVPDAAAGSSILLMIALAIVLAVGLAIGRDRLTRALA